HVPVLARALAGLEELHIGLDAALARVQPMMHEMLDQPVGRALPRHVLGLDDVGQRLVALAKILRGRDVVDVEAATGGARKCGSLVLERYGHLVFALLRCRTAACSCPGPAAACPEATPRS